MLVQKKHFNKVIRDALMSQSEFEILLTTDFQRKDCMLSPKVDVVRNRHKHLKTLRAFIVRT